MSERLIGKVMSDVIECNGEYGQIIGFPNGDERFIPGHLFLPFTDGTCDVSFHWEHYDHYLSICKSHKDHAGSCSMV